MFCRSDDAPKQKEKEPVPEVIPSTHHARGISRQPGDTDQMISSIQSSFVI